MLVLSFVALGVLWKRPQLEPRSAGRPLPPRLERLLRSTALRVLAGAISVGLFALVFAAALVGEPSPSQNLAPTFVLILFWLGLVPVQAVFGNVWRLLNPWLAVADAVAWVWASVGRTWTPPLVLPARLGVWPAAAGLFAFAAYELAYAEPGDPRALALAIALYSYAMWFGMAMYGRSAWDEHGNAFTVYFGLLARLSPLGERDGRLVVRTPPSGLAGADATPGLVAFVAVMLGTVGFDGFSRSSFWQELRADLEAPYLIEAPGTAELISTGLALAGMLAWIALVACALLAATTLAQRTIRAPGSLAADFVLSLVPVALVYLVAHYFTYFITVGLDAVRLASDPFGYGWNLFGTVDYVAPVAVLSPNTVWYVQVATLVAGHLAGLAVAHDRAVAIAAERDALRSQYAMLALMVAYTLTGMWLLSLE